MNICVFDTETTGLDKPFCYNIGYVIVDTETEETLLKKDFVVEQVWHNLPLFETAYYAEKRPLYVNAMKSRKTTMKKFGYITREMARDFENYNIENAYAFNSPFDERVFNFNCEWFKCINPFDNVKIFDIRAFAIDILADRHYKAFCEKYELFTESGNYSTTAESFYRYISGNIDFDEAHTALADSEIEAEILFACGLTDDGMTEIIPVPRSLERVTENYLGIKQDGQIVFETTYNKMTFYKKKGIIQLK